MYQTRLHQQQIDQLFSADEQGQLVELLERPTVKSDWPPTLVARLLEAGFDQASAISMCHLYAMLKRKQHERNREDLQRLNTRFRPFWDPRRRL